MFIVGPGSLYIFVLRKRIPKEKIIMCPTTMDRGGNIRFCLFTCKSRGKPDSVHRFSKKIVSKLNNNAKNILLFAPK